MTIIAKTLDDFSHIVRNHVLNGIEPVHIYYSCDYENIAHNQRVEPDRIYKYSLALISPIQNVFHCETFNHHLAKDIGETIFNFKGEYGLRPQLFETLDLIDGNIVISNYMDLV
ncbi:hypothetical protein HOO54_22225 [Bacillus sp. WMMC1349]|uniref:hypothetical protein n=1 Tax=Bacillus sp. WMMC1349 TaxID=2736254 RepID=UPI001557C152|nr:hypothetical protein [Bacillus sp. WMMC1349]NPC94815.1 hypothetical protein [Bacillus sp. WMMC1349]NPC94863.1 hypothetical protein [Bacillus sp. WMMC1349]